ncbi:MAG TPA: hypothetical protein H9820_03700 [Candidatus Companilactobacillus pullicola]|uniref:Uncharacterized protein n=1 Tax=Candidatus Companilactobacillus pullicola TaxID=2838523 RepID=A0A9D1ZQ21_9LACO|nr:hypothetical protein [Candidatus Companilactobacillus pullicola]
MQLNTDDVIKLAETGKVKDIELDDMAKAVLGACVYMLNFAKDCYLIEKKSKNTKKSQGESK